jgi:UMP-CMP kinase
MHSSPAKSKRTIPTNHPFQVRVAPPQRTPTNPTPNLPSKPNSTPDLHTSPSLPLTLPQPTKTTKMATPRFSPDDVTVVFFLGGPGSGKGTQSANLVKSYDFTHLSAGDLLRAEQVRSGSQYGDLIRDYIREGKIVPMEVTVALLSNAMAESLAASPPAAGTKARFLIDGFPRKLDQAVFFEETVCPSELVLFLDCPESVMETRLLKRGETSGRDDDNAASIRKRFHTFVETSMPVVEDFRKKDKVVTVRADLSPEEVYELVKAGIEARGLLPRC